MLRSCLHWLAVAMLAGCTTNSRPGPTTTQEFSGDQGMVAEYWAATKELTLPTGVAWPDPVVPSPAVGDDGKPRPNSFEEGYGRTSAEIFWFCSWEREWLAAGNSPADQGRAYQELVTYRRGFTYTRAMDDGSRAHVDDLLTKAGLGDPTALANDVKNNCPAVT